MIGRILVVDDEKALVLAVSGLLKKEGYQVDVAHSGEEALEKIEPGAFHLVITDLSLGGVTGMDVLAKVREVDAETAVIMITAYGSEKIAVEAMKLGASDYIPKPFDNDEMRVVVRKVMETALLRRDHQRLLEQVQEVYGFEQIVGTSRPMQAVYAMIEKVADTDVTVLIRGASGTGKELVANAIHYRSPRRSRPMVKMNCAALSQELVESELFGHERGAFTGATQRAAGRFEQASGGTLFLDEIGDMPVEAQTRLLRVLQEGEFTTVGGRAPIKANTRIIAATHRDLGQAVRHGLIREDLFHRLNVVPIRMPPLRRRAEDIPDLMRKFLAEAEAEGLPAKSLDGAAVERLQRHLWPGNVRELKNLVRRLAVLYSQEVITADVVEAELAEEHAGDAAPGQADSLGEAVERHLRVYFEAHGDGLPPSGLHGRIVREVERPLIALSLAATGGNQIRAAQLLGLNRNTLRKKIRTLDIKVVRGVK